MDFISRAGRGSGPVALSSRRRRRNLRTFPKRARTKFQLQDLAGRIAECSFVTTSGSSHFLEKDTNSKSAFSNGILAQVRSGRLNAGILLVAYGRLSSCRDSFHRCLEPSSQLGLGAPNVSVIFLMHTARTLFLLACKISCMLSCTFGGNQMQTSLINPRMGATPTCDTAHSNVLSR